MMRLLLCLVAALSVSACDTVSNLVRSSKDPKAQPAELVDIANPADVRSLWSRGVGAGATQGLRLAVSRDRVYVAGRDGTVATYGAAGGEQLWSVDVDEPLSGGVGSGDGLVLVATREAEVLALAEDDGSQRWRSRVSSLVMAPPAASDGVVVARTVDGKLYGLDSATGAQLWVYSQTVPVLTLRGTSTR